MTNYEANLKSLDKIIRIFKQDLEKLQKEYDVLFAEYFAAYHEYMHKLVQKEMSNER